LATERQIRANRANARLSTGPKTLAGKQKSSRNAYRHGLSGPLRLDPMISAKVQNIAHALAGEKANEDRLTSAADFMLAQLDLLRIRSALTALMEKIELNDVSTQELRRIAALDRYERYGLTKRRRASSKLRLHENDAQTKKIASEGPE
jgi:hypothetical protein